tara:strand:- start:2522 stop:2773 length:252 start_codon:yes stop_codon:yes gene_type:complete
LRKNFIVIKEKRKEMIIDRIFNMENSILSEKTIFFIPNIETAPKVGIESKKEIFDASYLLKFKNLAAVIVMPDLLTPGINDKI